MFYNHRLNITIPDGESIVKFFLLLWESPCCPNINFGITALPLSIFLSFTSEPAGEELGWRGFMREEFNLIKEVLRF